MRIYKPAAVNQITKAMLKDRRVSIVVENFHGVNWHDKTKAFPCFVVYDSPKDAPYNGERYTRRRKADDTDRTDLLHASTAQRNRPAADRGNLAVKENDE